MSQENARTVRRWLAAISNEEFDVALALLHRDVVLVPPGDQGSYVGAESVRRWMEPEAFPRQTIEVLKTVASPDGTILAKHHITARGRASGIELDVVSLSVWTFDQDGLITRIEIYLERDANKAGEAAGL